MMMKPYTDLDHLDVAPLNTLWLMYEGAPSVQDKMIKRHVRDEYINSLFGVFHMVKIIVNLFFAHCICLESLSVGVVRF
jgi:hypothetical protein